MQEADLLGLRGLTAALFDPERMQVLAEFSAAVLGDPELRRDSAAASLAYWLRRKNLEALAQYLGVVGDGIRVPAGLVFHVTPANVDTIFVYSWALSFLAGNANIVRLTTRVSELMQALVEALNSALVKSPASAAGNLFVSYEHNDALTGMISMACDQRIVWGGNETVQRLRAVPMNPHAGERSFASKRSFAVVKLESYQDSDPEERKRLADALVVDILPFGQMACSSPHTVYWLTEGNDWTAAARQLGEDVQAAYSRRFGGADLGLAVRRFNAACAAAAAGKVSSIQVQPHTAQCIATSLEGAEQSEPCGAGLLMHAGCAEMSALQDVVCAKHQTVGYFGLDVTERRKLAEIIGRVGADRVVPIGRALEFSVQWDGFNLWNDLTRTVVVS